MLGEELDVVKLLKKIQESTTDDIDEEKGSFKVGDVIIYNLYGSGLTNSDSIRLLGIDEHSTRLDHHEKQARIIETEGDKVTRYRIQFDDGFVVNGVSESELKLEGAEESEVQKVWAYTRSFTDRYVGQMPKGKFIEEIVERDGVSRNWVAQRTEETGNKKEIELASKTPGWIVLVRDGIAVNGVSESELKKVGIGEKIFSVEVKRRYDDIHLEYAQEILKNPSAETIERLIKSGATPEHMRNLFVLASEILDNLTFDVRTAIKDWVQKYGKERGYKWVVEESKTNEGELKSVTETIRVYPTATITQREIDQLRKEVPFLRSRTQRVRKIKLNAEDIPHFGIRGEGFDEELKGGEVVFTYDSVESPLESWGLKSEVLESKTNEATEWRLGKREKETIEKMEKSRWYTARELGVPIIVLDNLADKGFLDKEADSRRGIAYRTVSDKFRLKDEIKTNEATKVPQTMQPQEKPDINAEDYHMEDYSEEDLEKVKSKSAETGNAIRAVGDDELKQTPDKVVKPKKESRVSEHISDLVDIANSRLGWAVAQQLEKILENPTSEGIDEAGLNLNAIKLIYQLVKTRKDDESELVKSAIEAWVEAGFGPSEVVESKIEEKEFKSTFTKQKSLWLCNSCCKTFRNDKDICEHCQSKDVEKITELKGEVGFFKHVYQVDYKLDGKKDSTRVEAFDEFDAKRIVQRIEPKAIIIGAKKIGESKNSKQGDKEKEQIKKLSEGLEKLVDELLSSKGYHPGKEYGWAYGKMINIYPKEIEKIKTIIDQSRRFGPTTIKDDTIEFGKFQKESKLTEQEDVEDYKPGDRVVEIDTGKKGTITDREAYYTDNVYVLFDDEPDEVTIHISRIEKIEEKKLTETVLELVGEVPELTKEDEQILRWAVKNNILFNEWPPNETLIVGLQAKLPEEEKKKLETAEDIDLHVLYLQHILLPRAKKAWNEEVEKQTGTSLESKLNEVEKDWDLTFQYTHNVIESNPILDKKGDPFIWQRCPIEGKKVRVFTKHQAEWAERQGAIPVKGEPWEPKEESLPDEELPSIEEKVKVNKLQEQEYKKTYYKVIAKGVEDKTHADEIARKEKGLVVQDEDDPKKFSVIVKET